MESAEKALATAKMMAEQVAGSSPASMRAGLQAAAEKGRALVADGAPAAADQVIDFVRANPRVTAACATVGVTGIALVAAPMTAAGLAMSAGGWSASGPVAGTLASGIQASIGNVAAGSAFTIVQSAAMGGAGAATVAGVVQGVGAGIMTAAGATTAWMLSKW